MANKSIGVFVGSLRRESYSKKIAAELVRIAPSGYELVLIKIDDLPLFNQDFDADGNVPESYTRFRKQVKELDAVLFITPEYNRSLPAVLKNAIDVASRPYGQNVWSGKPGGIISSSIGSISGFGANHHLRQTLAFVNVYVMAQPEAYLANVNDAQFNADGSIKDERMKGFLQTFLTEYIGWVGRFVK